MLKALEVLNQGCQETGVCGTPGLSLPPGAKDARLMHRDDGRDPVLVVLWGDDAVSSPEVGYHEEKLEVQ